MHPCKGAHGHKNRGMREGRRQAQAPLGGLQLPRASTSTPRRYGGIPAISEAEKQRPFCTRDALAELLSLPTYNCRFVEAAPGENVLNLPNVEIFGVSISPMVLLVIIGFGVMWGW